MIPSSILKTRISIESQTIHDEGIDLSPQTPFFWVGHIYGNNIWSKHFYEYTIEIPEEYPYCPPIVKWCTSMDPPHPNIFSSGNICLNILKRAYWRPEYTMITIHRSLEWLLENPNYE
jgi:ubiquitin-protein ligase